VEPKRGREVASDGDIFGLKKWLLKKKEVGQEDSTYEILSGRAARLPNNEDEGNG